MTWPVWLHWLWSPRPRASDLRNREVEERSHDRGPLNQVPPVTEELKDTMSLCADVQQLVAAMRGEDEGVGEDG